MLISVVAVAWDTFPCDSSRGPEVQARTANPFQAVFFTKLEWELYKESSDSSVPTRVGGGSRQTPETQKISLSRLAAAFVRTHHCFFGESELWLSILYVREKSSNHNRAQAKCRPHRERNLWYLWCSQHD